MLKLEWPFNFFDSTNFIVVTLECISWHGIIKIGGFLGDFGNNGNISKQTFEYLSASKGQGEWREKIVHGNY